MPGDHPTEKRWVLTLPASGSTDLVVRPPDADRAEPWRFALLSDIQEAIDRVGDIYARMNEDSLIRFVVSSGDLTDTGTLAEFDRFQRELTRLHVPFYSTAGNHDISSDEHLFRDMFGRGNFHFVFRQVAFTFVDSASATIDPLAYEWLDRWLEEAKSSVHVVTMHIPPLDPDGERNAAFGSRNEAAKLLERLAAGHVDLTLYGHIHAYYAFANGGIPAYISGGGGAHPERMTGVGRHYVTVDVSPEGVLAAGLVRVDP